jgi:hypothetical protein
MGNYVIAVGNYVIVTRSQVGNYVTADTLDAFEQAEGPREQRKP